MLRKAIAVATLGLAFLAAPALASTDHKPEALSWSFSGPLGKFDQAQLQRGYKVYREVCAACHAMNLVSFRNLGQKGGPFYDPKFKNPNDNPYVKALAKDIQVSDIDSETGDAIKRPGVPADRFPSPFANDDAARASNGGALPPDLSVIAKARQGGPDYIHALLTGFRNPPAGVVVPPGKHYNAYFPGGLIAMAPPLEPNKVSFDDGTPSTVDNQSRDVAAFLMWTAEPKMEERKQFGLGAMIYLAIFAGLLYASYRRIWRNVAH